MSGSSGDDAHRGAHIAARISIVSSLKTDTRLSPSDATSHGPDLVHIMYAICWFRILGRSVRDCQFRVIVDETDLWPYVQIQVTAE